jgi:hypothetical protein
MPRKAIMDLITKLPEMSDDALTNLRTNAKRLEQSGTPTQRTDAAALLPAVEAEIGARRLARVKATRTAKPKVPVRRTRVVKEPRGETAGELE